MDPLIPATGLGVLHLFCKSNQSFDSEKLVEVIGKKNSDDVYEKAVFRVTITPKYDETKSPMDIRVVPWTDEMSDW